jgi:hypothetical protein
MKSLVSLFYFFCPFMLQAQQEPCESNLEASQQIEDTTHLSAQEATPEAALSTLIQGSNNPSGNILHLPLDPSYLEALENKTILDITQAALETTQQQTPLQQGDPTLQINQELIVPIQEPELVTQPVEDVAVIEEPTPALQISQELIVATQEPELVTQPVEDVAVIEEPTPALQINQELIVAIQEPELVTQLVEDVAVIEEPTPALQINQELIVATQEPELVTEPVEDVAVIEEPTPALQINQELIVAAQESELVIQPVQEELTQAYSKQDNCDEIIYADDMYASLETSESPLINHELSYTAEEIVQLLDNSKEAIKTQEPIVELYASQILSGFEHIGASQFDEAISLFETIISDCSQQLDENNLALISLSVIGHMLCANNQERVDTLYRTIGKTSFTVISYITDLPDDDSDENFEFENFESNFLRPLMETAHLSKDQLSALSLNCADPHVKKILLKFFE